ncbi:MAG: Nucleoside diphosphate kinase [Chloroflexi bacterium ADurb.Bin360]|nr:MAG: Nucleoside diphosphate kinase [Chloroflexi bacterium ADurb.Bin360]
MERTLIILKPDAIQRGLIGTLIARIEQRGLRIAGLKMLWVSPELAERHYGEHRGKAFYEPLLRFITSAPVVALVVEGPQAISVMRMLMGKTDARQADPGTIRGDFGLSNRHNLVHGSDSPESAEREIALWFTPEELFSYHRPTESCVDPDSAW